VISAERPDKSKSCFKLINDTSCRRPAGVSFGLEPR